MSWRVTIPLILTLTAAGQSVFARELTDTERAQLRAAAVHALVDRVQLDRATAEKVQQVADRYHDRMHAAQQKDLTVLRDLRRELTLGQPDAKRVRRLSDSLVDGRARLEKLRAERLREMEKVMKPAEFAKLLVQWPTVNRALRQQKAAILHS
jgi:hypothetical protein